MEVLVQKNMIRIIIEVIVREVRKGSYNHQSCWEEQVGLELDMEEWVGLR